MQRVDGALRLNVHAHTLQLDGVYLQTAPGAEPTFLPLPEPSEHDVQELAARTAARIERLLRKAGRYLGDHDAAAGLAHDDLAHEQPALSDCYRAAASDLQMFGAAAGRPALRLVLAPKAQGKVASKLCAQVRGINTPSGITKRVVHASAAIPGKDRARIERLCRYAARPPLAQERLELLADGRVRLQLKNPWADGTSAVVLTPLDFIARLVAAIPPPRLHMTRFAGVLAPHSALRPLVVPKPEPLPPPPVQLPLFGPELVHSSPPVLPSLEPNAPAHRGRHPWALLLRHAFALDVMRCAHCSASMRLLELCTTPRAIAAAMARAGLAPQPPPPPPLPAHPMQAWLPFS